MAAPLPRFILTVVLALSAIALPLHAASLNPAPDWSDGGLTRDSIAEATRPQPAKPMKSRRASTRRRRNIDPKDFGGDAATAKRTRPAPPTVVTVQKRARRNPVTGFVYWWNGWVIRTFHTRVGTVMLGTIGAKA